VSDEVRSELDAALADLAAAPDARQSAGDLREAVEVLEAGIGLRVAVADAYDEYFAVVFDIRDEPVVELARLVETRADYRGAVADLRAAAAYDPTLGPELDAVLDDPALVAFAPVIDELIERSMTEGVPPRGAELSVGTIFAELDGLTGTYSAAGTSKKSTLRLLDRAATDVIDAAQRLAAEAERDAARSYAIAGGADAGNPCGRDAGGGLLRRAAGSSATRRRSAPHR